MELKRKSQLITFSDNMDDLQKCIKACEILDLPFDIQKRNVGPEDNPLYFYYFFIPLVDTNIE